MATVTGMTAEAMKAIRDGAIVGASFNSANHLILTKYDGTTLDGGALGTATTTLAGPVELATNAETLSGSATDRAVTPAGLASLPGYRVQVVTGMNETDIPSAWPYGTSMQSCSSGTGGWTPHSGDGLVVTENIDLTRTSQIFYENSGGTTPTKAWMREYNTGSGGGGWTQWAQIMLSVTLNEAVFTQTTGLSLYPSGLSYLYYTTTNGTSWDFSGKAGTVETKFNAAKGYGRQTFAERATGSSNTGDVWIRTSDLATGWSAWKKLIHDPGAWISWTPVWNTSGSAAPSYGNASINCRYTKFGRKVDCLFEIAFGSTTSFGSPTNDNWQFTLPSGVPAARSTDHIGFVELRISDSPTAVGRARLYATNAFNINVASGRVDAVAATSAGVIDAATPFAWTTSGSLRGSLTYESAS